MTNKIEKMAWLTDLHLDCTTHRRRREFLHTVRSGIYDGAVVTGDISTGERVTDDLAEIATAAAPRPVYFVLGNHDYYGQSFAAVDEAVAAVCSKHSNLHRLDHEGIVLLSPTAALIGHSGWADLQAGYGERTVIANPDSDQIEDFHGQQPNEVIEKMRSRARDSAAHFRATLPKALGQFKRVWIATHVPPFHQSLFHNGQRCGPLHAPHFGNLTAGRVIVGVSRQFYNRRIGVLCGHTHHAAACQLDKEIAVRVGGARRGCPEIQAVLDV